MILLVKNLDHDNLLFDNQRSTLIIFQFCDPKILFTPQFTHPTTKKIFHKTLFDRNQNSIQTQSNKKKKEKKKKERKKKNPRISEPDGTRNLGTVSASIDPPFPPTQPPQPPLPPASHSLPPTSLEDEASDRCHSLWIGRIRRHRIERAEIRTVGKESGGMRKS